MDRVVSCYSLVRPQKPKLGEPFLLALPTGRIERAAIDPTTGEPSVWVHYAEGADDGTPYRFVIVKDDMTFPRGGKHVGMWWEASTTFHLYRYPGDEEQEQE